MKKLVAIILVALSLSMVAYGASPSTNSSLSATPTATASAENTSGRKKSTTETAPAEEKIVFESFTAIDNGECSVVVKEIDPDNMWGYTVKTKMENKSSDKTYMFSVTSASVDGVEADPFFAKDIAPGKKANGDISFSTSTLKDYGITKFTDIEIAFRIYDSNDWLAAPVAEEVFHIYPYGEEKATKFVRESQESDVVLAENDNISVVLLSQEEDGFWGYTLNLFIENKSDKELMFSVDEASVNGYMADPFFAKSVLPGKCAFTSMSWSDYVLEENDIEEIEDIEFQLRVYDTNNWLAPEIFKGVVTVNPQ